MTLGERIRLKRCEHGLSMRELGERLGITVTAVSRYESGQREPSLDMLLRLADALGTTVSYLLGQEDKPDDLFSIPGVEPMPKMKKVPRLGTIACGEPILAVENIETYDQAPEELSCDFTLVCKGDSMTGARIHNGDIVYIRQQPTVEDGEIAAVLIGDEVTLKRVRRAEGQLILWPENPAYAPMVFSGQQLEGVRIIGKAVAFLSKVK